MDNLYRVRPGDIFDLNGNKLKCVAAPIEWNYSTRCDLCDLYDKEDLCEQMQCYDCYFKKEK